MYVPSDAVCFPDFHLGEADDCHEPVYVKCENFGQELVFLPSMRSDEVSVFSPELIFAAITRKPHLI